MTLAELQQLLSKADPAAVLVSSRVMERVIQESCNLQGILWVVPHRHCFVVDRHVLFRYVEQSDLMVDSHQLLPPRVILLAKPSSERLSDDELETTLLKYWRNLFHANVHLVLEDRFEEGLLDEQDIHKRIDKIGATEFEEIKSVLHNDHLVPKTAGIKDEYIEFAAVFLELSYFNSDLLGVYFPAITDVAAVQQIVQEDLDAKSLAERTRLENAPDPNRPRKDSSHESHEYFWKLVRNADKAAASGNRVKSAILRTIAARVAPAALTPGTLSAAEADLNQLTQRLQEPLQLSEQEVEQLLRSMTKLLDKADQGHHPVEAVVLYDLQQICLDSEQEIYELDLVEWMLSVGKRPIKRPLPSQRMVRIIRHLRSAIQRLTVSRLSEMDQQSFSDLLRSALDRVETRLRERFRPVLTAVMEDVGLTPNNAPERAAFRKMIEEFLDRIIDSGFVTFSDLRDNISRNKLKMPDLANPKQYIRGDQLLQLDRRLATLLDGVYRPSEFYMRWLERSTSLGFGTEVGRLVSRFFLIPFGIAFVCMESAHFLLKEFHGPHVEGVYSLVAWAIRGAITTPTLWQFGTLLVWCLFAVFFMALFASAAFRAKCRNALKATGSFIWKCVVTYPVKLLTLPSLQRWLASWPVELTYWYVLKPLLACLLLWLVIPLLFSSVWSGVLVFLTVNIVMNSQTGMALGETAVQIGTALFHSIRSGLFTGVYNFIVNLFGRITHFIEYLLFSVDEWLRFRKGESALSLCVRTFFSALWFPIAFILRFYWIVLIEPMVNPIKLPICIIAGKLFLPFYVPLQTNVTEFLSPAVGYIFANVFAVVTVYLLPDLCGFLIWEFKENWSLYRANRAQFVQPVRVGDHGETVRRLLRPEFHSGTIPHLFDKLRRAERSASRSGNWRSVRSSRQALEEVKHAVEKFVTREMLSLLDLSDGWDVQQLKVGQIRLATNRISIEILHRDHFEQPFVFQIEYRLGWLIAGVHRMGWLRLVANEPYCVFLAGLNYLYRVAGIDLVTEQLQSALPEGADSYELTSNGLLVWLDPEESENIRYSLRNVDGRLLPEYPSGSTNLSWPLLEPDRVVFGLTRMYWDDFVQAWNETSSGSGYSRLASFALDYLVGGESDGQANGVDESTRIMAANSSRLSKESLVPYTKTDDFDPPNTS